MKHILRMLLFLLSIPFSIYAYSCDQYYINAEVQSNGDLHVEEYYVLNGTYNGSYNTIYYRNDSNDFMPDINIAGYSNIYNGSGIRIESVKGVNLIDTFDFNKIDGWDFSETYYASPGTYGVYINDYLYGGNKLMIYMPSSYNDAFYISYTITNAVVVHDDVAELWWKRFDSSNLTESIKDFQIKIKLPGNKNEFRVWAHGSLNGEVQKNGQDEYYAYINGVDDYQDISFRTTFDKSVVIDSTKYSNINGLPSILSYEEDSAGEANYQRSIYLKKLETEYVEMNNICLNYANHVCYDKLVELRNQIDDEDFLNLYGDDFTTISNNVIANDIEDANNAILRVKESLKYSDYQNAVSMVNYLIGEDDNLYNKLIVELNYIRGQITEKEKSRASIVIVACIGLSSAVVIGFIVMKRYYNNRYKEFFNNDYYRDIPNISITSAALLMENKIDGDTVSANILELANRGIIKITPLEKMNYLFEYNNDIKVTLSRKEKELIDLIFAGSNKVELKEMKKYKYREIHSYILSSSYENYKHQSELEYEKEGYNAKTSSSSALKKAVIILAILSFFIPIFFIPFICLEIYKYIVTHVKKSLFKVIIFISCLVVPLIIIGCSIYVNIINGLIKISFVIPFILITIIFILLIFTMTQKVYTDKGYKMLAELKGLKNFLNDFSIIDERELPEMSLWGNYMVFALLFGISDRLSQVMSLRLDQIKPVSFYDFDLFNNFDYIGRNIYNTGTTACNIQSRHNTSSSGRGGSSFSGGGSSFSSHGSSSSGSGGGGGFSSHSSGGGGGGGFGRF